MDEFYLCGVDISEGDDLNELAIFRYGESGVYELLIEVQWRSKNGM